MHTLTNIEVKISFKTNQERLNRYLAAIKGGIVSEFNVDYLFESGICQVTVEEVVKEN